MFSIMILVTLYAMLTTSSWKNWRVTTSFGKRWYVGRGNCHNRYRDWQDIPRTVKYSKFLNSVFWEKIRDMILCFRFVKQMLENLISDEDECYI